MLKFLRDHHILHTWSKWETVATGQILRPIESFSDVDDCRTVGNYIRQQRVCLVCNKIQLRTETDYGC